MKAITRSRLDSSGGPSAGGFTITDILVVLLILGVLVLISVPRMAGPADRAAVRSTKQQLGTMFAVARSSSVATGARTQVRLSSDSIWITRSASGGASVLVHEPVHFRSSLHVVLTTPEDSVVFDPRGFASNLSGSRTFRLQRNAARDSLCISRLGMVAPRCGS